MTLPTTVTVCGIVCDLKPHSTYLGDDGEGPDRKVKADVTKYKEGWFASIETCRPPDWNVVGPSAESPEAAAAAMDAVIAKLAAGIGGGR